SLVGSGHPFNIDGIGGGTTVTTKVAMLSKSEDEWADIDYFFAQVSVEDRLVDFKPTCGNILSGVAPAALEMGLIVAEGDETIVKIRAVNTEARIIASVHTPNKQVEYEGKAAIDGVPGTAAPIELQFMDVVGGVTGAFLPTGSLIDEIDGIPVTCMDVAMPMVIAKAEDFGLTGYESCDELDAHRYFYDRMEPIRIEAGRRMGMGDVTNSVTPKFGLLAPPKAGGTISARYFMPWKCHPTMAVTGAQCLAACLLTRNTVADGMARLPNEVPACITLEHASGQIDVIVDYDYEPDGIIVKSAGLIRTARKLAEGRVFVPALIWDGHG
ncbi:MAG: 4-oxalomesaconate tautomerase, partial [Deltaproteobacteria bacterium]|nr:4-oxalomesaconate tautomerase [Deltaproteobacteria bacterium]